MTNLLVDGVLYTCVGFLEWYLALRRTLACANGKTSEMVTIVFFENMLGLWVLSNFIRSNDWMIAIVYSLGASLGAWFVHYRTKKKGDSDDVVGKT